MVSEEKIETNSICEVCGDEFSCGAQIGKCWCFDVEVPEAKLEELKVDFKKCLCPNCLTTFKSMQAFQK